MTKKDLMSRLEIKITKIEKSITFADNYDIEHGKILAYRHTIRLLKEVE